MPKSRAKKPLRIVVLCGGWSSEREISLRSGNMVADTLKASGHRVTVLDPDKDIKKLVNDAKKFDVAFLALHGAGGEDGTIQGLLECIGLPYTGSGVLASALAMDKVRAKAVYMTYDIPTPSYFEISQAKWDGNMKNMLAIAAKRLKKGKDLFVKPVSAGSSVATSLVTKAKDLPRAIEAALKADPESRCLVEPRIYGRELTVAVMGNAAKDLKALPVIEIVPKTAFFDLKAKYDPKACDEICPAPIPARIAKKAQDLGIAAHLALHCWGYSRTDIMWDDKKDALYVLETNTLPGMTRESLLPKAAKAAGMDFTALLERMLALARERP